MYGCKNDEDPETVISIPNTCLIENEIIISEIAGIPENVSFNKVKIEITGSCWEVIDLIEANYSEGVAIVSLPAHLPEEKLQLVVRLNNNMCGFWDATSDNTDARVAALGDIIAYNNNEQVGRIYLSDWSGEGSAAHKSFVYYHYADRPFTLSGKNATYNYSASFKEGWNAYANINPAESHGPGGVFCTTTITEKTPLSWHFESWVY
ncbi:hypothetical protein [Parabacteroides sp. PF5-9]|uniref:hypothetical protein n=1 Tax=Parabacteroides sp. PF5-9 TaxID=1742404 RepID=UPI002473B68A|nr:hypothetical protein [Parabacteroides sp. PF5-9]